MKIKITIFLSFIINGFLHSQYSDNKWLVQSLCKDNKLYTEISKIDSMIYIENEEMNLKYNQSYYSADFNQEVINSYYNGIYLKKNCNKIISELICILKNNPPMINPRTIYLISFYLKDVNDSRYTEFLNLVLQNLENENFNCINKFDCSGLFVEVFYVVEHNFPSKTSYIEKNVNKEDFKHLLRNINESSILNGYQKGLINDDISDLKQNRKWKNWIE